MFGLKIDDLPAVYLQNTDFVRTNILQKLKDKSGARIKNLREKIKKESRRKPKPGHGKQRAHRHDDIDYFLGMVIRAATDLRVFTKKNPLEKAKPFFLRTFVREARPIHDLYEQAVKLLEAGSEGFNRKSA